MDFRLNPVALVTGAASGVGSACALGLAARARGGLILVDSDEGLLSDTADAITTPPERVSMLAFDAADAERWTQATAFISAQYGRLDWAVAYLAAGETALAASALSITRSLAAIMRANAQGGAVVVAVGGGPAKVDLMLELVRVANNEAATDNVRVNALLCDGAESALWRRDAEFEALVHEAGGDHAALARLSRMDPPLARCRRAQDPAQLAHLLLCSDTAAGVTLAVDASPAL
jgi:NAD(P)-dependent dehydrogenase (short-subunit alcohol dehydrogenase family)